MDGSERVSSDLNNTPFGNIQRGMDDESFQNMSQDDLMYVKRMQEDLIRLQM